MPSFRVGEVTFGVEPALAAGAASGGFTVASGVAGYEVQLLPSSPGPAAAVGDLLRALRAPLVVADAKVAELHLRGPLSTVPTLLVEATEATKSLEGASAIIDFLVAQRAGRASTVVAIGGGVVQDVAGFACGVFKRGLEWVYVPTTLLAQADSCIGAKTGINYRQTKNLLGLFNAPGRVVSHPGFLATLASDDLHSGLGEIFKLCVTGGLECLGRFEAGLDAALRGDLEVVRELAALSLAVKQPVIEADEHDLGVRRALNFGHSVGHAIESLTSYEIPHGIAVVLGALVECEISRARGHLDDAEAARLVRSATALVPEAMARRLALIGAEQVMDLLGRDKKVEGAVLKLAVPVAIGEIELVDLPLDDAGRAELERAMRHVCALL